MRALVTGGAGFIGSHVCEALLKRGYEVVAVDDLTTGKPENLRGLSLEFIVSSAAGPKVRELVDRSRFDLIVHLAARNIISSSTDRWGDLHTNVSGSFAVLEFAERHRAKVIFASSCSVYGQSVELPTPETALVQPLSFYAAGKIAGEAYCETFRRLSDLDITIVRYSNVYGPRQHIGVVPSMIQKILKGDPIEINGDGSHTRDYTYIDDAVEATMRLISVNNGVYNIASGIGTSTKELAQTIGLSCHLMFDIKHIPSRPIDNIEHRVLSCTALEHATNFRCQTELLSGLERTVKWWTE